MTPTMTAALVGLVLGLAIAWFMGTEGGRDALFVVLALGAGIALAKTAVV